jgi:hypothetical protein
VPIIDEALTTTTKPAAQESSTAFTADERCHEGTSRRGAAGRGRGQDKAAADAHAVQDAIAALPPAEHAHAEKLHVLGTEAAPALAHRPGTPCRRTTRTARVLCYFKAASKVKTRYAHFGFEARDHRHHRGRRSRHQRAGEKAVG